MSVVRNPDGTVTLRLESSDLRQLITRRALFCAMREAGMPVTRAEVRRILSEAVP